MKTTHTSPHASHGSVLSYTLGFLGSIVLTLAAFGIVYLHVYSGHEWPVHEQIYPALAIFALLQLGVQLFGFLHLGRSDKKRNLVVLIFAGIIVAIVVVGTLWIMYNLNYNMVMPADMNAYMNSQN